MIVLSLWLLAAPALVQTDKPEVRKTLDCASAQSIRDFKDIVYGELNPSRSPDVALDWAECLCGQAAAEAGVSKKAPSPGMNALPAMDAYLVDDHKQSLKKWKEWFKRYLPVEDRQAEKLALCTCRDVKLCAPKLSKKEKKRLAEPASK